MSPGWNLFNSQDSRIASQARISTGRQRAEPPPLDCPHDATGSPYLGVNLPETAGQKHKNTPDSKWKSGYLISFIPPSCWGLCVSSVRCDTLRYSADGNSTLQNNLSATPTLSRSFVAAPFQLGLVWLSVLSTLPPNPSACPRVSVWDKPWDKFTNYFETASPQFHFCPGDKTGWF